MSGEPDKSLATDRTALAWERMAISSAAIAAVIVRQGVVHGLLGVAIPLATGLLAGAGLMWHLSRHFAPARHDRQIAALTALIVVVAAGAAVLAVVG